MPLDEDGMTLAKERKEAELDDRAMEQAKMKVEETPEIDIYHFTMEVKNPYGIGTKVIAKANSEGWVLNAGIAKDGRFPKACDGATIEVKVKTYPQALKVAAFMVEFMEEMYKLNG